MKKNNLMKVLSLVFVCLFMLSMTACGKDKSPASNTEKEAADVVDEVETEVETEVVAEDTVEADSDGTEVDFSKPSIEIAYGDHAALSDIADKLSASEVEEGTVIRITGDFDITANPGVYAQVDDSTSVGLGIIVDDLDEANLPELGSKIEVTGVAVQGEYYTEFHTLMEHIKPVDSVIKIT